MADRFAIGPSIGVARLGNSPDSFYLEPETIGGLPIEADAKGTAQDPPVFVRRFKENGRIKRQAARFRLFRLGAGPDRELTLDDPEVASIAWTVHLANKKAAWFSFSELDGNLLYGPDNSYVRRKVPLRNAKVAKPADRRRLIVDFGPRTVAGRGQAARFSADSVPAAYPFASGPGPMKLGDRVDALGEIRTDGAGRLLVLGGPGRSGGDKPIESFGGADTWHDDISDGPVRCDLVLKSGERIALTAWCIVGSPKYVPEIVNMVTLDDTMFDVAVRHLGARPDLFAAGGFRDDYVANFDRDVAPILARPAAYRWVAAAPSLNSVSPPPFDPRDAGPGTARLRDAYLRLFRDPGPEDRVGPDHQALFSPDGFPLGPLNSGSNSVSDDRPDKFLTLTATQFFLLRQWARGRFTTDPPPPVPAPERLARASTGNCVGGPLCPGIEVTWTVRNPAIYDGPWSIRHRDAGRLYAKNGLDPSRDETATTDGCEPGDLTKRMAIPWQADFFECSVQPVNFTDPSRNTDGDLPKPPTFYTYWWPPQSPWQVISGGLTKAEQALSHEPAGQQVMYSRGVDTFDAMIKLWSYLGFVANQNTGPDRDLFPYFTEQERAHDRIAAAKTKPKPQAAAPEALSAPAPAADETPLATVESPRGRGHVPAGR